MIPKIIHYCWFGGTSLSETALKCIESWRKCCPDYEIKQWDEKNYDVNKYRYTKEAYEQKRYAFVTDVARLDIIYQEGGIYLDTDVELLKSLNDLLHYDAYMGMETIGRVNTGEGFGAMKKNAVIKANLDCYRQIKFDGTTTCVTFTTEVLRKIGLQRRNVIQELQNLIILPTDYLCPLNLETRKLVVTKNTFSIHHYEGGWKNGDDKWLSLKIKIRRWLGDALYEKVKKRIGIQ